MIKSNFIPTNRYDTFNKAILYTVHDYIVKSIEDNLEPTRLHFRIKGAISLMKNHNVGVNDSDIALVKAISKEEELRKIVSVNVSYLVYTLELMSLWVEFVPKAHRPNLNISDNSLSTGASALSFAMLKLKHKDEEKHKEIQAIIDDSVASAKEFFDYHKKLIGEEL